MTKKKYTLKRNGEGEIEYYDEGRLVYKHYKDNYGYEWWKEYNANEKEIYYKNSNGWWERSGYDENGKKVYYSDSDGYESRSEYDENGDEIYYIDSNGVKRGTPSREESKSEDIEYIEPFTFSGDTK
jgi:hypothetical protein